LNRRSIQREWIIIVAEKLGALIQEMVFVGGAATDLLITDSGSLDARSTDDVDVLVKCTTKTQYYNLEQQLHKLGFSNDIDGPTCRYKLGEITIDVMPSDSSVLGFSNRWYPQALQTCNLVRISDSLEIRVIDAPTYICTKLEAFTNRGNNDFQESHDIEDIVSVIDGRPELFLEIFKADASIRSFINEWFKKMTLSNSFADALPQLIDMREEGRDRTVLEKIRAIVETASNASCPIGYPETTLPKIYKLISTNVPVKRKAARFTSDQHRAIAKDVAAAKDRMVNIIVSVGNCYPLKAPITNKILRSERLFSQFKSDLDEEYCKVEQNTPPFPYYPQSDRDDEPWHSYVDLEIQAIREYLEQLETHLKKIYSENDVIIKSLAKLLESLQSLDEEFAKGHSAKKGRETTLQAALSPKNSALIGKYRSEASEGKSSWNEKNDFSHHSCEFCKPISIEDGYETLPAYAKATRERGKTTYQLHVWCRYCWQFHLHGGGENALSGDGDGYRAPHCNSDSWRYPHDYRLKVVGSLTKEILDSHKPDLRFRKRLLKQLNIQD